MEDLRLKHIADHIRMNGTVRLEWLDTGETFCPTVGDFIRYGDMYVISIRCNNDELSIEMKSMI